MNEPTMEVSGGIRWTELLCACAAVALVHAKVSKIGMLD